ncbi:MAG TPA: four helix bundle protein [Dehalococcoidia bacterium]|nr:four helix bundle protein [Dehalococcoidia bacterium]
MTEGGTRARHDFRNLEVWRKAQDLAVAVLVLIKPLPSDRATAVLVQQVVKSATSVGANVAEGHGRFAAGAYRNHLSIARGSANETVHWLDLLCRAGYITEAQRRPLDAMCDEILRMVSAQMIELDRQTGNGKAFREERGSYAAD